MMYKNTILHRNEITDCSIIISNKLKYLYFKLAFLICFLCVVSFTNAQSLNKNINYSQYTFIFKLDSTQTRMAIQGIKTDSAFYLTHLVDSFKRDTVYNYRKLSWGFYFFVSVTSGSITYQSYHQNPFKIEPWGTNQRNFLTIKTLDGKLISHAKITLPNGTLCNFNLGTCSYLMPEIKKAKLIKIEVDGTFDYLYLNTQYVTENIIENEYPDNSYTAIAPGYMVLNQPKFKLYDTLKWKAFLLYDDGTEFKTKLKLYLEAEGKEKFLGYIKPKTPGAYFGHFEIADTFLMDKPYQLLLKNIDNEVVKSVSFYVENYELKAYKYNLYPPKQNCITGDKTALTISALDANNLPVQDANIIVNLRIINHYNYLLDRQFIPDAWFQKYYQIEIPTDVSGYTNIVFPDSLFKNFDASYEVIITIKDLDNNTKEFKTNFNYINNHKTYGMQYINDSFKVDYFHKTLPAKMDLILETKIGDKIERKEISTPYTVPINFIATSYNLYKKDTFIMSYQAPQNYPTLVYFDGLRSGDSIHIDLINPIGIPVFYEVYLNLKKLKEGSGTSFHLHEAAPGTGSYHVVWGHNYLGGLVGSFKVKSFHLAEKKLNVIINQPEEIYPGQTLDIAIKVTDIFNQPVPNVNLTAYAVNSQFENIPAPNVPYLGLTKGGYPLQYAYPVSFLPNIYTTSNLKKHHFKYLNLFKNEYYQLFYGKGGKNMITQTIKRKKPELSAYVIKHHQLQNIVYIKVDNQLVYHQYYLSPKTFSFPVNAGKHNISIRTFDKLLTYENLQVENNKKYVIGFNLDSIKYINDTNLCEMGTLKNYEKNEFIDHALFLSFKTARDTFSIVQKKQFKIFSTLYDYNNSLATIRMEDNNYLCVGPLNQEELILKMNRHYEHQFLFERGNAYLIYSNEVKNIPLSNNLKQYDFTSNVITNANLYNLNSFDKLFYSPEYDTIQKITKDSIEVYDVEQQRKRPFIQQKKYLPYNYGNYSNGRIQFVMPNNATIDFKNAWLINKTDKTLSIINYQERNLLRYYFNGEYDLLLFTDTSYCIINNLYLNVSGSYVLFVKPEIFKPFNYEAIYPYEKMINELTKKPFRAFTDIPFVIKPYIIEKINYKSTKAKITGTILDAKYNTPIDFVNLYAEIDGYYKAGATTNADGKFELNEIPAGNYMLKIRSKDYRYQIIYNLKIESGKELVIRINLLHQQDHVYYNEDGEIVMENNIENTYNWKYDKKNEKETETLSNSSFRSFNSISSHSAGVTKTIYGLSGKGSREDGTVYFVDGVRSINGNTNIWEEANDNLIYKQKQRGNTEFQYGNAMQNKLEAMAHIAQANRIRDKFRDYGYWVPNLITNSSGMAYCTVTFPDNITAWQTFVPAMNGKLQSGMKTMQTKSFKPLVAQMAVPFFLTEGDAIYLKGKVINYTGIPKNVNIQFLLNDSLITNRDVLLDKLMSDSLFLTAKKGIDSISTTFSLKLKNGYYDGEKRIIPVHPNAIVISKSQNIFMDKDTNINIYIPNDLKSARILVHNSEVERLLHEIEVLKNYTYGCVEQTTSKLRALLAEKAIKQTLNLPFTQDKMVRKMINRLASLKSKNGLWAWWGGDNFEDNWLSAYVLRTLNEARLAGYNNNVYAKGANFLEKRLKNMATNEQLYTLKILKDMERDVEYDTFLKYINPQNLNVNSQLLYYSLIQKLGKPYQLSAITQHLQYNANGGIYWGTQTYNYKNDLSTSTLLAYDILSRNDTGKKYLPYIKQFFYSSGFPRHTFALAEMINAGVKENTKKTKLGNQITGNIVVNNYSIKATEYPFKNNLNLGDTVRIKHTGTEAYATIITSKLETNPQINNTYFTIKSQLDGKKNDIKLKPGQPVTMIVEVENYKTSENVMLEIPIPAGFSYFKKPAAYGFETYREYYYDKTSIFCSKLESGKYTFTIELLPKYSGTINLPPAKIELMYYPEIYNNEAPKIITVE